MNETPIQMLNDADWRDCIGDAPALLLISDGDGLRGDFSSAFKKAALEKRGLQFAQINPKNNPQAAALFDVSDKPLLIGWYKGEVVVRRSRPWGSDVTLAIELLEKTRQEDAPATDAETMVEPTSKPTVFDSQPVKVTDTTFQKEVIDYSHEMPVLVDFWAEWCGPCRMVAPILDKLAKEFAGQIRVAKVNTDENQGLAQYFQIMSIPTIMAVKGGAIVFSQPGAFPEAAFRDLIKQLIALDMSKVTQSQPTE